jgi:hypothetical protein
MGRLNLAQHIMLIIALAIILSLGMAYPFLSGKYDRLAMPIAIIIQVFGIMGLSLVPLGVLWLSIPKYGFGFAITALVVSSFVVLIMSLFAALSAGYSLGALMLLLWILIGLFLVPKIKSLREHSTRKPSRFPLYLICLPVLLLLFQLAFAKKLTQLSRDRAIENAAIFIDDIENYHTRQGHYPLVLQAQNKDYDPAVVGIEKYIYSPHKKGYNLAFEQPRFLLDDFGAREWVVYNPLDENAAYSHTVWLLNTGQQEIWQGWYSSASAGREHWKFFLFD